MFIVKKHILLKRMVTKTCNLILARSPQNLFDEYRFNMAQPYTSGMPSRMKRRLTLNQRQEPNPRPFKAN